MCSLHRRLYDRTLHSGSSSSHHHPSHHTNEAQGWHDPRRHGPGARHAWSKTYTTSGKNWSYTFTYNSRGPTHKPPPHTDERSYQHSRRTQTRTQQERQDAESHEEDRVRSESSIVRFVQVASILAFVMFLSGTGVAST